jgi:hypothetical protein
MIHIVLPAIIYVAACWPQPGSEHQDAGRRQVYAWRTS